MLKVMLRGFSILLVIGLAVWAYFVIMPPPPPIVGGPGGPPITAPRIKLRDGRHLAYKEFGVPKETAKHKFIFLHGFASAKNDCAIAVGVTPEKFEELGVYIVSFDRPGYGESDADPKRTLKSLALDVEQLADQLGLGAKFYAAGYSMGGNNVWGLIKYIPHRLAGVSFLCPVINYWWHGLPGQLSIDAFERQVAPDQWAERVAHYAPWLLYWWNTQNLFPPSAVVKGDPRLLSPQDLQIMARGNKDPRRVQYIMQQGIHECYDRDMIVGFGSWDFVPMYLENPFPNKEGSVHMWHGNDDRIVSITLQKYIVEKLGWIQLHEVPGSGHMFPFLPGMSETILKIQTAAPVASAK